MAEESTDPRAPSIDWRERYAESHTPWSLGGVHPGLADWLEHASDSAAAGGKALVPGCGHGFDARALALAGFTVDALDITDLAGEELRGDFLEKGGRFHVTNVLGFDPEGPHGRGPYDFCYEHTLFCAIRRDQREAFGATMARSIKPGGLLLSLLFPVGKPVEKGGPPFGVAPAELALALGSAFELLEDEPWTPTSGGRPWLEHRLLFRRL